MPGVFHRSRPLSPRTMEPASSQEDPPIIRYMDWSASSSPGGSTAPSLEGEENKSCFQGASKAGSFSWAYWKFLSSFLLGPRQARTWAVPISETEGEEQVRPARGLQPPMVPLWSLVGSRGLDSNPTYFSILVVQPWTSDFASGGISLAFSKVILLKSALWRWCEESVRTRGETLIDLV